MISETKLCKTCKKEKSITEFKFKCKNVNTNKMYYNLSCMDCIKLRQKIYREFYIKPEVDNRIYKSKCKYCNSIFKTSNKSDTICNGCNALQVMKNYINLNNILMTWI